ncbi:hypothetical protein EGO51_18350 [Haloarcula hispanica]|uniref:Pyrrolo-quinoline quinone repeat domain-containing protein n=1 Tax=Haloarcula hispanica TaxID=51589 RepID=A0A5J5LEJ6_HALHI|nr:PQQ-binding-like beta-propeller repeat protein [Haloarcula hispanica]KAA9404672.1 hypothetical protein EGO51_18350 [Haloarcula hispanica]RLM41976.1 hypothetical protein DVK00_18075 [Haloarcula sp. Atlit-47R]
MPSDPPSNTSASRRRYLALAGAAAMSSIGAAGCLGAIDRRLRGPQTEWRTVLEGERFLSSPIVNRSSEVLAMGSNRLYALDASTGDRQWRTTDFEQSTNCPVIADGVAVVAGPDRRAAYHPSGTRAWIRRVDGWFSPYAAFGDGTVIGGYHEYGTYEPPIVLIDTGDGRRKWETTPEPWLNPNGTTHSVSDIISVGEGGVAVDEIGRFAGLDSDGSVRWAIGTNDWRGHGSLEPALATDGELVVAAAGSVIAVDPADGTHRWRASTPSETSGLAVADGTAFISFDGHTRRRDDAPAGVLAVDLSNGSERWQTELPDAPGPPGVGVNDVVVGTEGGDLVALDAATGDRRWSGPVGNRMDDRPLVMPERVIAGGKVNGDPMLVAISREV